MKEYTITIDMEIDDNTEKEKLISAINDISNTLNATEYVHSMKVRLMTAEYLKEAIKGGKTNV